MLNVALLGASCSLRGDFLEVGVLVLILGHAVVELAFSYFICAGRIGEICLAIGAVPVFNVRIAGVILRCRMVFGICMGAVFGLHARARAGRGRLGRSRSVRRLGACAGRRSETHSG